MNTYPDTVGRSSADPVHVVFLGILPRIVLHGSVYFRHVRDATTKEEFIAETVALAWKWCVRLTQKGKDVTQFPSAIATFAARAVRSGRRLCRQENGKDALSPLAQTRRGFAISSIPDYSTLTANPIAEALADNTVSPVPDQVAFRLDFPEWLRTYDAQKRRVIEDLMLGERTLDVAETHGLSPGRVSQMRRQFMCEWLAFIGDA